MAGLTADKTVAFIQFRYRTENAIFIGALSDLLRARGATGLFITDDERGSVDRESETLHFVITGDGTSAKATSVVQARARPSPLKRRLHLVKKDARRLLDFSRSVRAAYAAISRQGPVMSIVGIEPYGGVAAGLIALALRKPFYYCSMELQFSFFTTWLPDRVFGALWKRLVKAAVLVTVQDRERAAVLQERVGLESGKVSLLPVGTTARPRTDKTRHLYRRLNIDPARKIVLYAGSIRPWAQVREIAAAAQSWPDDYCLVVHGFVASETDEYVQDVRRHVDGRKVYLSTRSVAWSELDDLLCSAHLSIAAYSNEDVNTAFISASSNKLATYARCGLPLLISHSENVARMFEVVRWGVTFKDWAATPDVLAAIESDYEGYRLRSFEAFRRFYDLNVTGRQFADAITGEGRVDIASLPC